MERYELPEDWEWSTLGKCCQVNYRDPTLRKMSDDTLVSFVPMAAVDADQGFIAKSVDRPFSEVRKGFTPFSDGDVIFAKITPSMENGKAAIATGLTNGFGFGSTEFHVMRPKECVIAEWVFHFIRQQAFRDEAKASFTGTAGQLRVAEKFILNADIPLPPVSQQERIVAKIENLFAQSHVARTALERVPALMSQFRRAVLASAFHGELIEPDPNDEPAVYLLERIREARQRSGYKKTIETIDTSNLPELPNGWEWTSLGNLLEKIEAGHSFKSQGRPAREDELGVIKVSAMTWGKFLPQENKALFPNTDVRGVPRVCKDDLLISRANTVQLVGAVVLVDQDYPNLLLSDKSLRLVPASKDISKKYLLYALRTKEVRRVFEEQATGVSESMRNISQGKIQSAPIPLAPLNTQNRIVEKIETMFAQAEIIEQAASVALRRAEQIDQSILARAFRGDLK